MHRWAVDCLDWLHELLALSHQLEQQPSLFHVLSDFLQHREAIFVHQSWSRLTTETCATDQQTIEQRYIFENLFLYKSIINQKLV